MLSTLSNSSSLLAPSADKQYPSLEGSRTLKPRPSVGKPLRFLLSGCQVLVLDGVALLAAYVLMSAVWPHGSADRREALMLVLSATYVSIGLYGGSYSPALAADAVKSAQRAWLALFAIIIVEALTTVLGSVDTDTALTFVRAVACTALTVGLARLGLGRLLSSTWWQSRGRWRTIILLDEKAMVLPKFAGLVFDVRAHDLRADANDPKALARLGALTRDAERVVVACPVEKRMAWIAALRGANVPVEILVEEMDHLAPVGAGDLAGRSTLKVAFEPLTHSQRLAKRLFDVGVATIGLVVLMPLLLATALAVKLDSPGTILFRQPRIGRSNKLFEMYKFRSMRTEVQDLHGSQLTNGRNDDRVTRVGRFIRATSIDELPQIINVLRGDMSIVGPRPHALGARAGNKLYWEVDPAYWHRHAVKPGLTGLAQVRGFRGTTFADADLTNRLNADLEYVRRWSLTSDVGIVFRTVMALTGKSVF
ncbi:exopolysaccharide biosynthesis polyprenyl glycosylphosphotransferase (plasmid) [Novosphingobium sp. BL-8A]|uniref:exopolysaccharide biosynthesis polyprenyl glycosylphosphotransferase n=1 Tax=Novosphingobium sp. BL-8A TaxID=3127639 RepID=UPI0037582DD6